MKSRLFVICTMLLLCCAGCLEPSPQDWAEATVIAAQPGQTATAAAPNIQATATAVAVKGHIKAATEDDIIALKENVIWWSAIALCVLIMVGVIVIGKFAHRVGNAAEKAAEKKLDLAASVIHINKKTKTWPILVDWDRGKLLNLETGERVDIRSVAPADPRLIAISHRVREAGIYADATRDIGKSAKDARAADMLPGVAANVPLLDEG